MFIRWLIKIVRDMDGDTRKDAVLLVGYVMIVVLGVYLILGGING